MSGFFVDNVWVIPCLPLIGGLLAGIGGRWLKSNAHIPVVAGIALAFLFSLGSLANADPHAAPLVGRWLSISGMEVPFEFRVDGLTTMMLSMVTFVSTLVAIFAVGYMNGDPGYPRFFAFIGLFVFSMTGLVLSNNYALTYAFWEGVGVCSYMLIGYWYTKPSAAAAAMKAFLVNRIGDVGFAVAIFWLWSLVPGHDLSYTNVLSPETLAALPESAKVGIPLLLFWAATAKSAQVPLYVWLPDAMEGPTPVSALIHAATMVTAGVYLIARSTPLVALAPGVQALIAATGCLTALLAASIALTQNDLKRVMAYSTVSQLGYMFMGLGAGVGEVAQLAVLAAMFHLFTHAFFKALLFLASGSVMHAMGDVIDMRRFGGLRHRLPYTHITFAVGALALSGVFPLSGFFSKDEILLALKSASHAAGENGWGSLYMLVYWVAVFTALMTAFYTGRAYFLTFWGPDKLPSPDDPEAPPVETGSGHGDHHAHGAGHDESHGHHHVGHESPPVMTIPLMILAACAILVGMLFGPTELFAHHLEKTLGFEELGHGEHAFDWATAIVSTIAALAGLAAAYLLYATRSPVPSRLAARLGGLYRASLNKFYVDEAYDWIAVKTTRGFALVSEFLDVYLVHRLVLLVAQLPRRFAGETLFRFQNGLLQFYAGASAVGVAVLLFILLFYA
ncbi:NADH-quinone oxidoreductase subunit L [Aquisphaera giovannonii]|uniref:NADH-quinone oxidoreductase subunit L n=1 Tax=Aquisphaera giovannonii TaxID=406548 RepID=A0A5B9VZH4_9BACT|nr:NADH-quinone oxidoreductase subunit L [Aquisphaera giovannonii]QEH33752.1 NADH-quinone oxidoreductase subunit L [Aquisphaera giovannonii]